MGVRESRVGDTLALPCYVKMQNSFTLSRCRGPFSSIGIRLGWGTRTVYEVLSLQAWILECEPQNRCILFLKLGVVV